MPQVSVCQAIIFFPLLFFSEKHHCYQKQLLFLKLKRKQEPNKAEILFSILSFPLARNKSENKTQQKYQSLSKKLAHNSKYNRVLSDWNCSCREENCVSNFSMIKCIKGFWSKHFKQRRKHSIICKTVTILPYNIFSMNTM